jgi:hypothetical protein
MNEEGEKKGKAEMNIKEEMNREREIKRGWR